RTARDAARAPATRPSSPWRRVPETARPRGARRPSPHAPASDLTRRGDLPRVRGGGEVQPGERQRLGEVLHPLDAAGRATRVDLPDDVPAETGLGEGLQHRAAGLVAPAGHEMLVRVGDAHAVGEMDVA